MTSRPLLTIVVPVKDEEESVPALAEEIRLAFESCGYPYECLWVNDGSSDKTLAVLGQICASQAGHRIIDLDRNYGQSAALSFGIAQAGGEIIATLDGDGQNDPADLPGLVQMLQSSDCDMVNGYRQKREDSLVRKISSRIGNGFRNGITGESVRDVGCSTRVFYRRCFAGIPVFKGMHRFLPTLLRLHGARIAEYPVNHRPRTKGRTKYGINNRLWVGLMDTIFIWWYQKRHVEAHSKEHTTPNH